MVAFLSNQMNVGAFKINSIEKPEAKAKIDLSQKSDKYDFSKELRSAVGEKRLKSKNGSPIANNFEKKLSKFNHEIKQKVKEIIQEKQVDKRNPYLKANEAKMDEAKAADVETIDTKTAETKPIDSNPEEEVKNSGNEGDSAQLSENLTKIAEQLVGLIQDLQKTVDSKATPTDNKLLEATDLLEKINLGKIGPQEALVVIENLIKNLSDTGKSLAKVETPNTELQKLMEISDNKLKVLKNEISDAKDIMNKNFAAVDHVEPKIFQAETAKVVTTRADLTKVSIPRAELAKADESQKMPDVTAKVGIAKTEAPKNTEKLTDEEIKNADASVKTESVKANVQKENSNSGDEAQTKGNDAKTSETGMKVEKESDGMNFQTITQNLSKEIEKPSEVVTIPKAPIVDKTEVLAQLVKKAELLVGKTNSEMIMQLDPENLGKVTLKIAVERGNVTATFIAENQQVKALIESNTSSLREMLQEKGMNISAINVSVNQHSGENSNWQNQNRERNFSRSFVKTAGIANRGDSFMNAYGTVGLADSLKSMNPYTRHDGDLDLKV